MSKISNIFSMLELLSNGKIYKISELAERLEVTERMVRVYKDELEKAGIYIDTIRGPYGGYVLDKSANYLNLGFSKYDVEVLSDAINKLKKDTNFKAINELNILLEKIKGKYTGSKKLNKVKDTKGKNSIEYLNIDNKNVYNILSQAVKEKRKVKIKYLKLDGENFTERIIHPCNLFLHSKEFYTGAFCEKRNEIRHFQISRIIDIVILDEKFD